jgi:putative membrane protein
MATKLPEDATLEKLADGSQQVAGGAEKLHTGLGKLSDGTGRLEDGVGQLHAGAGRLSAGLDQLAAALPGDVEGPGGDASGLSSSVEPVIEALTTVSAYGTSMAPYFAGLSLWVGVVMASFMFQLRWFSSTLKRVSKPALFFGRSALPLAMAFGQGTLLTLALRFVVGVEMPSLLVFWLITLLTSAVFFSVLMMLLGLLGDSGKVAGLLLLIFQMASSGGIFPVQLSGGVYAASNAYLPFTWVLRAYRATLFGAYNGTWLQFALIVLAFGAGASLITARFGRWKTVPRKQFVPALDV